MSQNNNPPCIYNICPVFVSHTWGMGHLWQIFLTDPGEHVRRGPSKKSATEPPSPMCVNRIWTQMIFF